MRDYDEHFKSDYQGRDIQSAYAEARRMVDTILTPLDQTPLDVRQDIASGIDPAEVLGREKKRCLKQQDKNESD